MNTITNCSGPFRTAWCDLLDDHCSRSDIVHLYYKIEEHILREVNKRTSYIGKYRVETNKEGTVKRPLLEEIELGGDEWDMFLSLCRDAMVNVFGVLEKYTNHVPSAYLFDEGHDTLPLPSTPPYVKEQWYEDSNGDLYKGVAIMNVVKTL